MYFKLFKTFFKIGLFTFGGGYAMIPIIQKEVVVNNQWMTDDDILDIIAIGESTPGPISVNCATFVGYKKSGLLGAACSTFGLILPSFLIIYILSFFLDAFQEFEIVQYAFNGIRAGIVCLLINALISMYKKAPHHLLSYIIMVVAFTCIFFLDLNAIYVIILSAIISFVYCLYKGGMPE